MCSLLLLTLYLSAVKVLRRQLSPRRNIFTLAHLGVCVNDMPEAYQKLARVH